MLLENPERSTLQGASWEEEKESQSAAIIARSRSIALSTTRYPTEGKNWSATRQSYRSKKV